jgi:RNA polymerase sigma-70 factor (ECF subfamily)
MQSVVRQVEGWAAAHEDVRGVVVVGSWARDAARMDSDVLMSDGGGVRQAALRPVIGAEKVARFAFGGLGKIKGRITVEPTVINGNPALVVRLDGEVGGVMAVRVEDARITGLYFVGNPEKLSRVESETPLTLR